MSLDQNTIETLRALQSHVGEGNRARGFREDEEMLDKVTTKLGDTVSDLEERIATGADDTCPVVTIPLPMAQDILNLLRRAKTDAIANRLLLIVGEVIEAHEEIRSGKAVDQAWYSATSARGSHSFEAAGEAERLLGQPGKPEGVPSEITDVIIRALDFADIYGIDLGAMVAEKDAYNATREYRHGRKF